MGYNGARTVHKIGPQPLLPTKNSIIFFVTMALQNYAGWSQPVPVHNLKMSEYFEFNSGIQRPTENVRKDQIQINDKYIFHCGAHFCDKTENTHI